MAVNRTKVLEAAQKFLAKGQYDKAVVEYQKLVHEDPRDVRTLLKIGDLHTRRNKPKDAIDIYEKVADLYAKQGFFLKAVAVYKQILKLDAAHLGSMQKLAKMYEELALTSDALSTYELVADAYVAQGQLQRSLEILERMIELDGQNVAVRIKHAEALSKAGKAREAAQAFASGAQLLKDQGRMDDYLRVVERQLYHDPENVVIARELSRLYLERNDPKRALAKLQICFKADPRDVQTLEMLAEAFRQLGQHPKTISVLKEIARLHAEAGSDEPRRRALKRVLDLDPNDAEAKLAVSAPTSGGASDGGRASTPSTHSGAGARPTAAPPPRRGAVQPPPPPAAAKPPPPPIAAKKPSLPPEEIDLEAEGELEMVEDNDPLEDSEQDDVLIVDEPDADARAGAAPTLDDRIHGLLGEADAREGAGDYEGAVAALQGVLELDPAHVAAHERLKDIYIAADRRVDAVKELLWLSSSSEERSHDRAVQYAQLAFELAPRSEATRRRLDALGVALPDESQAKGRSGRPRVTQEAMDAELDAIMPPISRPPPALESTTRDRAAMQALLELPFGPDDFDAPVPAPRRASLSRAQHARLLEQELAPGDFPARAQGLRPARRSDPSELSGPFDLPAPLAHGEVLESNPPSVEFAAIGTSELSVPDPAPRGQRSPREESVLGRDQNDELLRVYREARVTPENDEGRSFERPPETREHEYTLDDQGPDPTIPGEPVPELLRSAREPAPAAEPTQERAQPAATPSAVETEPEAESGAREVVAPSKAEPRSKAEPVPVEVEEALDEAEFFASQGQLEEALEVVQEAILIYPTSAALKQRLAEYEQRADQQDDAAEAQLVARDAGEDESFDIAEQLANQLVEVDQPPEEDEMIDVESVFAQFKKGVAEQIAPDDSETHFDLGIAYKEMGLLKDAVSEFELAAKSKKRACTALTMVGMCHLEQGNAPLAITYFQRALDSEGRSAAEELALNYEIGLLYEGTGELDKAVTAFEKVAARDRTYRGVSVKLDQIKKRGKSAGLGR